MAQQTPNLSDRRPACEASGADGLLIVTPYYNKPTQEGLYQHYKAINDKCGIPIIIYNIPGRSVIDMSVDTMARLYELKNIVGVKDATGDLDRLDQTIKKLGTDFIQLTGEDGLAFQFNKRGWTLVDLNLTDELIQISLKGLEEMKAKSIENEYKPRRIYYDHLFHKNLSPY